MTTEDKKEIKNIIGEAFEDVILPVIQEIKDDVGGLKDDVAELKDRMENVENGIDRIERKQDAEILRHDEMSIVLERHEKILTKSTKS